MSDTITKLDHLYEHFYIATYGCNRRLEKIVKETLEKYQLPNSFVFHEYFFHQPLCKSISVPEDGYLLAPFAIKMIEKSLLVPHIERKGKKLWKIGKYIQRNDNYSRKCKIKLLNGSSWLTQAAFVRWNNDEYKYADTNLIEKNLSLSKMEISAFDAEKELGLTYPEFKHFVSQKEWFGLFSNFRPRIFKEVANNIYPTKSAPHDVTNYSRMLHYGFMKLVYPSESEDTKFFSLFIPIASSHIFYGAVWFKFPIEYKNHGRQKFFVHIGHQISQAINEIYVPVLSLLHNHICEKMASLTNLNEFELFVDEDKKGKCCYLNVFRNLKSEDPIRFSEPIEKGLVKLWERREEMKRTNKLKADDFIFRKYLAGSKRMVELTRKVIEDAENIVADDKCLPSALIIGGAGSGKDTFSQMPRIFSESFCLGERHTLNMASLKPAPLVSGMVTGFEAEIESPKGDVITYKFRGILQKIRQETKKIVMNETALPKKLKDYKGYPTLVLDELNSMDVDSQGVLLRFLENAEMIPLGAIKDNGQDDAELKAKCNGENIKIMNCCLVIGVMNEDPDELSREKAMDFINDRSYLGGLLGDFLYEQFTKMRRLRPDIKYRMSRNGKYKLPLLRERKEDIPLLFYLFCENELKPLKKQLHVTLEAFDTLMSDTLLWRGNVREVQALVKRVVSNAVKDLQDDICIITYRHVNQGLRDLELI